MLHKVIKRVARFAARGADSQPKFRSVRWLPATQFPELGQSAGTWLVAFDGLVGIACHVDDPLPSALLPTDGLAQAVSSPIVGVADQGVSVALQSSAGGVFQVPHLDPTGYPMPPRVAAVAQWDIWPNLARVVHCAAGANSGRPTYEHVCLRPSGAEATDSICLGHAPGWGWDAQVLVPARIFGHLDREAPLSIAIDDQQIQLWAGGLEMRWGAVRRDLTYPDCRGVLESMRSQGHRVVVPTKGLLDAVRQAVSISAASAVALVFQGQAVGLLGWRGAGEAMEHQYDVTLPVVFGHGPVSPAAPAAIYVDGRLLVRALRAVDTPTVMLGVAKEHDPLRLEWAGVMECIWPWRL
ncbi:MAG: hypothetical protein JSU89_15465 [Myxococcales bacterium]|nr:MAG: hypothetical protein JSU89_15465 [Myxococcales bacterium]